MRTSGLTKIGRRRVKDGKRNLERVVYMDIKMHTMEQNRRKFERDMANASPVDRKILALVYVALALWIGVMLAVL